MSCETWESMIALEAGGDLPADDAEGLARHLATCDDCHRFAEEMRQSQRAVGLLASVPVDERALATVRAQVLNKVSKRSAIVPFRLPPRVMALAAALAVAFGTALLLRSNWPAPEIAPDQSAVLDGARPPERGQTERSPEGGQIEHSRPSPVEALTTSLPPAGPELIAVDPSAAESPADDTPRLPTKAANRVAAIQAPIEETTRKALKPRPRDTVSPSISEPMVIKLVSDEADLVIYWLVDPPDAATPNDATKETNDEISAV